LPNRIKFVFNVFTNRVTYQGSASTPVARRAVTASLLLRSVSLLLRSSPLTHRLLRSPSPHLLFLAVERDVVETLVSRKLQSVPGSFGQRRRPELVFRAARNKDQREI